MKWKSNNFMLNSIHKNAYVWKPYPSPEVNFLNGYGFNDRNSEDDAERNRGSNNNIEFERNGFNSIKHKNRSKRYFVWACLILLALFFACTAFVYFTANGNLFKDSFEGSNETDVSEETSAEGSLVISETPQSGEDMPFGVVDAASDNDALSLKQIIKKNKPAVVGVVSSLYKGTTLVGKNTGSGIIMSDDGYVITNNHVVEDSYDPSVVLYDGREFTAEVVGRDEKSDLAVLKIDASGLVYAEFGDSDTIEEGDLAVAIGNPMGLELSGTVTAGIISAVNRDLTINDRIMTLIQTDASINPGNSGGPLINQYGQVIGINSVKIASSEVEGLGFAIPINFAKPIIDDLIENGYVKNRPVIGISGQNVSQSAADFYGMPRGVYVDYVSPSGYAVEAGLREGDIITGINGKAISSMSELNYEKEKYKAGDTVVLSIWREGSVLELEVRLAMEKNE